MRPRRLAHLLLTAPKRCRRHLARRFKGTAGWRVLRTLYRGCAPLWKNPVVSSLALGLRRLLYRTDPRGYWEIEGGERYMEDDAFLLGSESATEMQGRFLASEIRALSAASVLEIGCGYGRMLKEIRTGVDARLCGVDFSGSQLEAGREYMAPAVIPLVLADATSGLPFRDAVFDLVYTQGCLMHVPPPRDRMFRIELARIARRHIIHTEEFKDSVHVFAHDNEEAYRALGFRLIKAVPYPHNPPGQKLTFSVFERQAAAGGRGCAS
jgi:SAM-dependent methyltransferase